MECKNCGKIVDQREEKKFCSGCGAIIGEEKPVQKAITHEHAKKSSKYFTQRAVELDMRTRFFYTAWLFAFFVFYFTLQIITSYFFLAFIMAIPCGALVAVLGVIVFSRLNANVKDSFNEKLEFVPSHGPGRAIIEALASVLPLMAKLPDDFSNPQDKKSGK